MKEKVDTVIYESFDKSLPVSNNAVKYPINAFLSQTLSIDDEINVVLLTKNDGYGFSEKNKQDFINELNKVNEKIGAKISYKTIDTEFKQEKSVHEYLMVSIVEEIDVDSHIMADITYGSKDLPIVLFSALNFAEKFLKCEINHLIYGQANFENGKVVNTQICDMLPLYYLNSVTDTVRCDDPIKAKNMLKSLLSL